MEYGAEIKAAIAYMEDHLAGEIRAEDVAKAAGFSKYHFHRIFKRETGLTLHQYIQKRKMCIRDRFLSDRNGRLCRLHRHGPYLRRTDD